MKTLDSDKPLMQSFNFTNEEFKLTFGCLPPKILNSQSENDIYKNIYNIYKNKNIIQELSNSNLEWFNKYHDQKLVIKWANLLKENL